MLDRVCCEGLATSGFLIEACLMRFTGSGFLLQACWVRVAGLAYTGFAEGVELNLGNLDNLRDSLSEIRNES